MALYERLAIEDIRRAADELKPVFEQTGGADGYASIEVSPYLARDTEATVSEARRLAKAVDRPNVMVKVPATKEGLPAIRRLTADGLNVNITLLFSQQVYEEVVDAYLTGLEQFVAQGGDPSGVASVASFFVSRIDLAVDKIVEEQLRQTDDAENVKLCLRSGEKSRLPMPSSHINGTCVFLPAHAGKSCKLMAPVLSVCCGPAPARRPRASVTCSMSRS